MIDRRWEMDVLAQPDTEVLHRSARFSVVKSFESAILCGAELHNPVVVGDFYGDPAAASIDVDEEWCVVVGSGLIAYQLASPWRPFAYPPAKGGDQWWEFGRGDADTVWFDSVVSDGSGAFVARGESGEARVICRRQLVDWTHQDS